MKSIHGFPLSQIYAEAYLDQLGFSFEQFATAPIATLYAAGQADAIDILRMGWRPLLPSQVALRRTLEAAWQRDGHPAESHRRCREPVPHPNK
jgi:hypothetical protein